MPQAARGASQEYWRPADPAIARIAPPILAERLCRNCGVEYSAGARFCHMCGADRNRPALATPGALTFVDLVDLSVIRERFGLSAPCLVFFVLAVVCMIVALGIGLLYKADTLEEWQAMEFWRVEWMLGAVAAMLAGILLKKLTQKRI